MATSHAFQSPNVAFELDTFLQAHHAKARPLIPIGNRGFREHCPRAHISQRVWVDEGTDDGLPDLPSDEAIEAVAGKMVAGKRTALFRRAFIAASLVLLAIAGVALSQRFEAVRQQAVAKSRELAYLSVQQLPADPPTALRLAIRAMDEASTGEAESALRRAVPLVSPYTNIEVELASKIVAVVEN